MRHKLLLLGTLFLLFATQLFAQQPTTIRLADYAPDMRFCISSAIANNGQIDYKIDEENFEIHLFSTDAWDNPTFAAYLQEWKDYVDHEYQIYESSDKETQGRIFTSWKESIPQQLFAQLFRLMLTENPSNRDDDGNQSCATSDPFCTTDVITFHVDANPSGTCESGPDYDCLEFYTARRPYWFHMKIGVSGAFTIRMTNSANVDIDYCCWGPFDNPETPCPHQLQSVIDCGASGLATETCHIPSYAQVGQYYIMVITKWDTGTATDITFQKVTNSGPGETDCTILPPLVNNDGPFCVGDDIHLTGNAQSGASYQWTGPHGFNSNQQNPTIHNCTLDMAGTYTCTITVGSQHSDASTTVRIFPQTNADFTASTECFGNSTQFTNTSTTIPPGQQINYLWDFGDGQTSNQFNPTHQFSSVGNHNVTLTTSAGNGQCSSTKTVRVTVLDNPMADAGEDQVIEYGSSTQLSGSGGTGNFNYHWEPANKVLYPDLPQTPTIPLTETVTYTLTVMNPEGECVSSDEVNVLVSGGAMAASVNAMPGSICLGNSTQLQVNAIGGTGDYTYSWSPTTGLGDPHISNPIAYPAETTTYTCTVSDGQTSQTLSVTVTVNYPEFEEETQYICPDETVNFYGQIYHEEGDYEYHTTTAQGCDKTITLHLHQYPAYENGHTTTEMICGGTSYLFHGHYYNTSGIYVDTLQTIHGCDSLVWLNLTVYPLNDTTLVDPVICESQTFLFHGTVYDQDGTIAYFDTIDSHGCPKVEKLMLTVGSYQEPPAQNEYICYSHDEIPSFYWDKTQETYHEDTYKEIILPDPQGGCDFKYRLNLKFHQEYYNAKEITECDSYYWPITGQTYTNTTHLIQTFDNGGGSHFDCDSIYILDLTINHSYEGTKTVTGQCDEYIWHFGWNDESYSYTNDHADNEWTRTIPTSQGCDSTVTLRLQMDYSPDFPQVEGRGWVVGGSEFQYTIEKYWIDTPSESSHLTDWYFNDPDFNRWQIIPFGLNNDSCLLYIFTFEKDSIELCAKTHGPCGEFTHSKWIHCSFHGVEECRPDLSVEVFPNPNDGEMTFAFENMKGETQIEVHDLTGTLIDQFKMHNTHDHQIQRYHANHLPPGVYFFIIKHQEKRLIKKVVIVK